MFEVYEVFLVQTERDFYCYNHSVFRSLLLGLDLQNLLISHDSEADAVDEVILKSNLELDKLLDAFNQFNLVSMFTLAIALNHQLLSMRNEFQADKAALSVRCLDFLDR